MANFPNSAHSLTDWSCKAKEMAAEAKVLSGSKLEQLVIRIQRHTGRPKEACWRFVIQYGIKEKPEYRRWRDFEFELVRQELVKGTVEQVAKKLNRTPKAVRNVLRRNQLSLRDIRCIFFWSKALQQYCECVGARSSTGLNKAGLQRASGVGEHDSLTSSHQKR